MSTSLRPAAGSEKSTDQHPTAINALIQLVGNQKEYCSYDLTLGRGAKYCNRDVCTSVCWHISKTTCSNFKKSFCARQLWLWLCPPLITMFLLPVLWTVYGYTSIQIELSSQDTCLTATGTHVQYGITQYYLPLGRGNIPAFTPAKAGTGLSDPGGMQG